MTQRTDTKEDAVRRLVNRANRLQRLLELNAPWPVIHNECTLVEQAAHLIDNQFGIGSDKAAAELDEIAVQ